MRAEAVEVPESAFWNVRSVLSRLTPARYTSTLRAFVRPRPANSTTAKAIDRMEAIHRFEVEMSWPRVP